MAIYSGHKMLSGKKKQPVNFVFYIHTNANVFIEFQEEINEIFTEAGLLYTF